MMSTHPNWQISPYFPFQLHKQAQISFDASLPGEALKTERCWHVEKPANR
jgi:hypothetical protein